MRMPWLHICLWLDNHIPSRCLTDVAAPASATARVAAAGKERD
jgi:hypothetical protein